jgi:hypothetical protein
MGDKLIIERHCVSNDTYDDYGYCDTKIKKGETIFLVNTGNNYESYCSECLLISLLHKNNPKSCWFNLDFEFIDFWFEEHAKLFNYTIKK